MCTGDTVHNYQRYYHLSILLFAKELNNSFNYEIVLIILFLPSSFLLPLILV